MIIKIMSGGNIYISIRNTVENIGNYKLSNYLSQFISLRPDQLAIANKKKLVSNSAINKTQLIIYINNIYCLGIFYWIIEKNCLDYWYAFFL